MKYPAFLKKGSTIGISAPSAGVGRKIEDYDRSLQTLQDNGWHIYETAHVRVNDMRGGSAKERGEELTSLFLDDSIDFVMCAAGGDFLDECLPYVDFAAMGSHPKWLMGASDPTGLLFPYTVLQDVATLYGANAGSFDMDPMPDFRQVTLKYIKGKTVDQKSYKEYMKTPGFLADGYLPDTPVHWIGSEKTIQASGRCIGGCIDVLKDLIGTPWADLSGFQEKYRNDGFIWYFDNFSLSAEVFYRTLLQFRYAGWFRDANAVIIGRTLFESNDTGMSYEEAAAMALEGIPYVFNADVGHTDPSMMMINGAMLDLTFARGKGKLKFRLE